MATIIAIIAKLIPLIPTLKVGVAEAINLVNSVRAAAIQTGEWPQQLDDDFRAALIARVIRPEYQMDPALPTLNP